MFIVVRHKCSGPLAISETSSTLPTSPRHESLNGVVAKQKINRVVVPSQLFLIGNELMDRLVTIATHVDGLPHPLP